MFLKIMFGEKLGLKIMFWEIQFSNMKMMIFQNYYYDFRIKLEFSKNEINILKFHNRNFGISN